MVKLLVGQTNLSEACLKKKKKIQDEPEVVFRVVYLSYLSLCLNLDPFVFSVESSMYLKNGQDSR